MQTRSSRLSILLAVVVTLSEGVFLAQQGAPTMRGDGPPPAAKPFSITRLDPGLDALVDPSAKAELMASGFGLNEGPVWVREGTSGYLVVSGLLDNVLYKIAADKKVSVFLEKAGYSGTDVDHVGTQTRSGRSHVLLIGPSCASLDSQGRLIWCADNDRTVMRLEKDGTRTVLSAGLDGKRFSGPNDIVVRSDDGVYLTDNDFGLRDGGKNPDKQMPNGIWLIKDGQSRMVLEATTLGGIPNGIVLSPDERYLYLTTAKQRIVRYEVKPDGSLGAAMEFTQGPGIGDGMKVDRQGNVYSTSGAGPGIIRITAPTGTLLGYLNLPISDAEPKRQICATNVAFGDPDSKSLYITACDAVYRIRMKTTGVTPGPKQAQGPAPAPPRAASGPLTFDTATGQRIRVTQVAGGLVHPYSLALPDPRTILVAERAGRLRIIKDGVLAPQPAWEAPPAPPGSPPSNNPPDALHFIELHPGFAQNRWVYLSYPKYGPRGNTIAVGRGKLTGDVLVDFLEIFVSDAWESYGANPGRMLFGRDGTLYVTVGDRDRYCCDGSENTSQRMKAQTLDNDYGKILRIRDDGSIPPDNPFVGRPGARPEIFSYGHRNAYGLAFHPDTGELWESEIGPLGGDEVNILRPGHNYGWPLVSTGRNYTGTPVSDRPWTREGMDDPRMHWNPVISPSGLIFYTGDRFKGWNGSAFLGALNGKALWRVSLNNPKPQQVEQREVLLTALDVRIRDVQQGPDGNLYIATERGSAGARPDGTVMRIEPAP